MGARAGRNGIYIVPQLGGTPRRVAAGPFIACWSPDGSTIATAGALDGKIRLVDHAGGEQRTLTLEGDHWSIWDSTVGRRRAVAVRQQRPAGPVHIATIRADGSDQRKILSSRTEIPSTRWTPKGDAIYFFQRINQTMSLFRISTSAEAAETSGTAVLTGLETDRLFALSADARRLVYARAPYPLQSLDARCHDRPNHRVDAGHVAH